MNRRFYTLDVFTKTALAGNPLAVVLDCDGLSDAAMQAITREFNLSETVFVFPPQDSAHRAALRIFTPGRELPFAGHPTVGTAVLLATLDGVGQGGATFVVEEKVGLVPCRVVSADNGVMEALFTLPRLPQRVEPAASVDNIARAIGVESADIGFDAHQPSVFSAGVGFTLVPLNSHAALAKARINRDHWHAGVLPADHANAFIYCRETTDAGHQFHARMFAPDLGVGEDPATGSAVAAFAGAVAEYEGLGNGQHVLLIEQGYEMGRPSLIRLEMEIAGGALVEARIGGGAVIVSEGVLRL
jgi:trans-2,3-dihydro-3-hydroxyanthranilate isomerase